MAGFSSVHTRLDDADDVSRLEDFAAAMHGWFWETDADHRFIYMSASVERIVGIAPEWHYGKTREDLGSPNGVSEEAWAAHLLTIRERRPFERFAYQRIGPERVHWLQTSGRPVFAANGAFLGYRGVATDVTAEVLARQRIEDLARMVEARQDQEQALAQAVETLTADNMRQRELSLILAHDLRSPLASVRDSLAVLLEDRTVQADTRTGEYVSMCVEALDRMMDQVADAVKDAIKTETVEEPVDLNAAASSALADLGMDLASDAIRVTVDPMPKVLGNAQTFRTIFVNLFSNSVKYKRAGAPLAIYVGCKFSPDGAVCIQVSDNGEGINAEDLGHVFDPGFRAERHGVLPGTGQGLAFVKAAIVRLGGDVSVESAPGQGAVFLLEIPAPNV